jgi:hypothetical protein
MIKSFQVVHKLRNSSRGGRRVAVVLLQGIRVVFEGVTQGREGVQTYLLKLCYMEEPLVMVLSD